MTLGGMFRSGGPTISSGRAYAWIANIQSGKCIKPWAMPYSVLFDGSERAGPLAHPATTLRPRRSQTGHGRRRWCELANLSGRFSHRRDAGAHGQCDDFASPPAPSPSQPFPRPYQCTATASWGTNGQTWYQVYIWNCDGSVPP
jgi:hypothetical protein